MAIDDNTSYELTGAQVKDLANKIKAKAADNIFVGATSAAPGSKGLVPQPQAGDNVKYLRGDGTWATPSGGGNAVEKLSNDGEIIIGVSKYDFDIVAMPARCPVAAGVLHDGSGNAMFNNNPPTYITFTVPLPAPFADYANAHFVLKDPIDIGAGATMEIQFTKSTSPTDLVTLTIDSTYYQQYGQNASLTVMQNYYVYTSMVNITLPLPEGLGLYRGGPTTVMIKSLYFAPYGYNQ